MAKSADLVASMVRAAAAAAAARALADTGRQEWEQIGDEWSLSLPWSDDDLGTNWDDCFGWLVQQWRAGAGCRWSRRLDRATGRAWYRFEEGRVAAFFRLTF